MTQSMVLCRALGKDLLNESVWSVICLHARESLLPKEGPADLAQNTCDGGVLCAVGDPRKRRRLVRTVFSVRRVRVREGWRNMDGCCLRSFCTGSIEAKHSRFFTCWWVLLPLLLLVALAFFFVWLWCWVPLAALFVVIAFAFFWWWWGEGNWKSKSRNNYGVWVTIRVLNGNQICSGVVRRSTRLIRRNWNCSLTAHCLAEKDPLRILQLAGAHEGQDQRDLFHKSSTPKLFHIFSRAVASEQKTWVGNGASL